MMRIPGLIAVLVIVGLFIGASFFVTDSYVEELLESQASNANGAKVEIDNLHLDVFDLKMSWDRIQITNPKNTMTNTLETGRTDFDVLMWPLILGNNVIVENMQLNDFQLNTERETDGRIELPERAEGESVNSEPSFVTGIANEITKEVKANAQAQFDGVASKLNADSLVASINLVSVKKMDSLKTSIESNYSNWNNRLATINLKKDAENLKKQAEAINLKNIKDIKTVTSTLNNIKTMRAKVDSVRKGLATLKKDFENDVKATSASIGQVDNWIKDDYDYASNLAKLPKIDAQNIGQTLFGEELLGQIDTYLGYVVTAREYLNRLKGDEEEQIERYKGKNYRFSDKYDYPGFWVKNIDLSGTTNTDIKLSGKITDITNDQKKVGATTLIDLSGVDEKGIGVAVKGELDYLGDESRETFEAGYQNFSLKNDRLSPSELIPYDIAEGNGNIKATLNVIDKRIQSEVSYVASNLTFDFSGAGDSKSRLDGLIRSAISSSKEINASALIDGTEGNLDFKIRSNLDDLFVNALRSTISREVENAKAQIRNEVDKQVNSKKAEVEELIASTEQRLRQEYAKYEKQINDQLKIVDEKKAELDKKKKEIEDSAKGKVKDVLKKIGFDE